MRQWILSVVAVGGLGTAALGDIINVPGDFPTINQAIIAATDGDEIVVAPGVYSPEFGPQGKAITIRSSDGPDVTVIEGVNPQGMIQVANGEGQDTVIDGFTVNGGGVGSGLFTAGVVEPTILNCVFTQCVHGAKLIDGSGPTLTNCTFDSNTGFALENWDSASPSVVACLFIGHADGAVQVAGGTPSFRACTFTNNTGSAMLVEGGAPAVIGCEFLTNDGVLGGAIYTNGGNPTIANCLIADNHAMFGGGLFVGGDLDMPVLVNCTVVENQADVGGGLLVNDFVVATIVNSIIWGNSSQIAQDDLSVLTITYSTIEGGWLGAGNISADPLFADPASGDYRLQPDSPAIDAGHNNAIAGLADTDLDGNPRFADGRAEDTGCGIPVVVDMGAYEFQGDPFPVKLGDLDGDGAVGVLDFLALLAEWGPCPAECCLADLDLDGEVGVTDFLTLLGNWG